jgi:hypothetical protein
VDKTGLIDLIFHKCMHHFVDDYNINSADLTGHMSNYNHSPWNNGGAHHGGSLTSGIPPGGGPQNLHGMSG